MPDHRSPKTDSAERANRGAIRSGADVRAMFDRIVPRYDLMNRIMTGGRDRAWRTRVAKIAIAGKPHGQLRVIDVATGTGELTLAIARSGAAEVLGIDFSGKMIAAARKKAERERGDVQFEVGDAMELPFADGSFNACTVSFGLRNMPDYDAAIAEMSRILKPGGQFICLEMTPFRRPFLGPLFRFSFKRVMPLVGGLLSGNRQSYRYLPASVAAFPDAPELAQRMRDVGLDDVQYAMLGFGTVAIHSGVKPG